MQAKVYTLNDNQILLECSESKTPRAHNTDDYFWRISETSGGSSKIMLKNHYYIFRDYLGYEIKFSILVKKSFFVIIKNEKNLEDRN